MTTPQQLADAINEARSKKKRSLAWVAEESCIADKTLRRRMKAPEQFTLAELSAVAGVLDTSLEELVAA